ncbi:chromate transporter [Mycoplasma struthionis]|uniref:Chromate transporter n=1 Tax=Mycoplasma struthionis TaxID=538220 RepID=A0A3G8LG08_9MOLU|nr:chromate transporter [Mycoplasma struthionis]AZG68589.1 chromate transporter [Mycoplasma struthionis]TPI02325.1 chromate transporter [Mycoplasma struthionis]
MKNINQNTNEFKKPSFWKVFWFIIYISFIGFGGGNALMPVIKKEAVDKQNWLSESEFDRVVIITNMLPGASVIEAIGYVSIKCLGFWKGLIVTLVAILPHCLLFFGLFLALSYVPKKYLYLVSLGVLISIVGFLINFGVNYLKKSYKKMPVALWLFLFVFTLLFSLLIPVPYNMPVFVMVLIIVIFFIVFKIQKRNAKRLNLINQKNEKENIEKINIESKEGDK